MSEDIKERSISAFAFNTARALEDFLNYHNNGLMGEYELLQGKILDLYSKHQDKESIPLDTFKKYFNIQTETHGEIKEEGK